MRMNLQIRMPQVRLIDENGKMIGIVSNNDAQHAAHAANLDLVEIDPNQHPPICKIMDYGKFKYSEGKKLKEQKKSSKSLPVKEVQFAPNIDVNDMSVKTRKIREFIEDGHKVKITMRLRGREMQHIDLGKSKMQEVISGLEDVCKVEQALVFSGNTFSALLGKSGK